MAPPRIYPDALEQLGILMTNAMQCDIPFEQAWAEAVRPGLPPVMTTTRNAPATAIRWPTDHGAREESVDVVTSTREGWRRQYERVPETRAEQALRELGGILEPAGVGV